jgi:signal transduction histidine kinase/CheY-like chemotaxis protein
MLDHLATGSIYAAILGVLIFLVHRRGARTIHALQAASAVQEQTLAGLRAELAGADSKREEFLAHAGHELRAPLATMLGYSDLLLNEVRLAGRGKELAIIQRNAQRLMDLIDELLECARGHADPARLQLRPVQPAHVLEQVMRQARHLARAGGNRAVLELHGELPAAVLLDPDRLQQVLLHLLNNAARFTRHGTLTLRVSATQQGAMHALRFDVEDDGIGIAPALHEAIFKPFFRAAAVTSGTPGSGLGLAVSRLWVHAMGGDISVSSKPAEGSSFSFTLNCAPASDADLGVTATCLLAPGGGRVMLVEDSGDVRHYLAELLAAAGYTVICAANGRAALDQIAHDGVPPDAVLTDQTMPELDGWGLLRELRQRYGEALPVLLLSAGADRAPEGWPVHLRFDAMLRKSVDTPRLLEKLLQLMRPATAPLPDQRSLPCTEQLRRFLTWAEQGALSRLEDEARQLDSGDPASAAFAAFVLERADALDVEGIAAHCARAIAERARAAPQPAPN